MCVQLNKQTNKTENQRIWRKKKKIIVRILGKKEVRRCGKLGNLEKKKKLTSFYATFLCGRYNIFKKILTFFFVPQNIEKLPWKVAHNPTRTTSFQPSKFFLCETETILNSEIFSSLKLSNFAGWKNGLEFLWCMYNSTPLRSTPSLILGIT